ncbi:MAG: hypothetical protein QW613_04155 [Thermoprotei archaeon]
MLTSFGDSGRGNIGQPPLPRPQVGVLSVQAKPGGAANTTHTRYPNREIYRINQAHHTEKFGYPKITGFIRVAAPTVLVVV